MESRKHDEIEFHNRLRGEDLRNDPALHERLTSNYKFYSIDRGNRTFCEQWLRTRCPGKKVLDYCCGEGEYSLLAARLGGSVVGIDISDVSVDICRERATRDGLSANASF